MRHRLLFAALLGVLASSASAQKSDIFVDSRWLADHLNDPKLVLIQIAARPGEYEGGHIAGARRVLFSQIAQPRDGLSSELVPVAQLDSLLRSLGVSNDSRIVIYGNPVPVARLYMTLDYVGLGPRVSVLDGGLAAWKQSGHDFTTEEPKVARGSFASHVKNVVVDANYVRERLDAPNVAIVDARDREYYDGTKASNYSPRPGHIAKAVSIPFSSVTDESGRFKDRATLAEMFRAAGVKPGAQVVTYCHIGMQGSVLYLAAKSLGYDVRLYDGSIEDWGKRSELPMSTK